MFPLEKINKKYFASKPWLTGALKESIRAKNKPTNKQKTNKLYISRYRYGNPEENIPYYKRYRNGLNHVLWAVEIKYHKNVINEHKSKVKKSWLVVKMIINMRKYQSTRKRIKYQPI